MCKRDFKVGLSFQLLTLLIPLNCLAVERTSSIGAREEALAMAVVSLSGSFSVFHNQAMLTDSKWPMVSLSYRQPYWIKGYNESAISFVYPTATAVLAIGISQAAIATYKESSLGLSIAKQLTRKLSVALLFNYFSLNLPEVGGHTGSFQLDGGVWYKYSDKMSMGFHLRNIVNTKAETIQYLLTFPLVVRGGVSYQLTQKILLMQETVFENRNGFGLRFGTEYLLNNNFCVRGGISTNPFRHSFGFGYRWNFCQLDFAMVHHEMLGYTPSFSVSFCLKQAGKHSF
jgi:hypothetical protein